ncbi:MAG: hypothetical protein FWE03_07215 [Firmicutes bacterium]|nr:hypothetical protein [Bacillota bacterium]
MKRIIIVIIIFSALLSIATFEIVYSTSLYTDIHQGLVLVSDSIDKNRENLDNPETIELMQNVMQRWNKGKELLFMFGNTTLLRSVDDRLVTLNIMIQINHKDDAPVAVASAKSLILAVLNDTHPVPTNLF